MILERVKWTLGKTETVGGLILVPPYPDTIPDPSFGIWVGWDQNISMCQQPNSKKGQQDSSFPCPYSLEELEGPRAVTNLS